MLAAAEALKGRIEMQKLNTTNDDSTPAPRARCIIEFIEGDLDRPPVVYPLGGADEIDTAMFTAIMERWGVRE
jgi:hypothetical protein